MPFGQICPTNMKSEAWLVVYNVQLNCPIKTAHKVDKQSQNAYLYAIQEKRKLKRKFSSLLLNTNFRIHNLPLMNLSEMENL